MKIAVIGNDRRFLQLSQLLYQLGYDTGCRTEDAQLTVTSWPPSEKLGNGRIASCGPQYAPEGVIDLLKDEDYQRDIACMTAEGAISAAMTSDNCALRGAECMVVGWGRIGRALGRMAAAMGMKVLASGSRPCPEGEAIADYVPLEELLAKADVISLNCPLTPQTEGLINRQSIERMKPGVILINNGRGPLVMEQDLADALNCGRVYAAGLDVVSVEPIRPDTPLLTAKNCIITPHISWAARESRQRLMDIAVENLRAFLAGRPVNVVNGAV